MIQPRRGGQGFSNTNAARNKAPTALEQQAFQLIQQNRHQEALAIYNALIQQGTSSHLVYFNAAAITTLQGDRLGAIALLQTALDINPNHANSHFSLGNALQQEGQQEGAIHHYRQAIELDPTFAQAHNNLGIALQSLKNPEQALACLETAVELLPSDANSLFNLGNVLIDLNRIEQAIEAYERAAELGCQLPMLFNNLGNAFREIGRLEASQAAFERALKLDPQLPEAHWNSGLTLLLGGDYAQGWGEYEWRFRKTTNPMQAHAIPRQGGWCTHIPRAGEPLMVVSEQGLGDTLQFMRYVAHLRQQGLAVEFCAQTKLHGLIQASGIHPKPLSPEEASARSDLPWMPLLSLPHQLGVGPDNPLVQEPYINSTASRVQSWRRKITPSAPALIGINWQGDPATERDEHMAGRSLALACLAPLAQLDNVQLVSLQKGFGCEQLDTCNFQHRFVSCQHEISQALDFLDCAAVVAQCDLIVTCDTVVAHLAAGMGKPTWLLLKAVPDWRWGLEGDSTFWYPSMRLFRQERPGDWHGVIERVCEQLRALNHN